MQSKPKIILLLAATQDKQYQDILNFTAGINAEWLQKNEPESAMQRSILYPARRPASWFKLLKIIMCIGRSEYVIWIDADCFIKPDTQLADLLPANSETFRMLSDANGCNCGVIAMPNEPWAVDFLDRWWLDALPDEITHPWWENKTAIRMMGMQAYRDRFGISIPVEKVVHASGIAIKDKLAWLKERYEKLGEKE